MKTLKLNELILESMEKMKQTAKEVGINVNDKVAANVLARIIESNQNTPITKAELDHTITSGFQIAAAIEDVTKRGPGRPRKVIQFEEAAKEKRGPGRPKKDVPQTQEIPIISADSVPPVKRGPGRPRKNPVTQQAVNG